MENRIVEGVGRGSQKGNGANYLEENKRKDTMSHKTFIDISKVPYREEEMY